MRYDEALVLVSPRDGIVNRDRRLCVAGGKTDGVFVMTEEEAKQRWCPFARVVEQGSAIATHNRVQLPTGRDVQVPVAGFCIASSCMAWRVKTETRRTSGGHPYPVTVGYCGLAGRPE